MPLPTFMQRARRSLQRIDYYAARRSADVWSRARRRAVVWSVPLALIVMIVMEAIRVREETLRALPAVMQGERTGPIYLSTTTDVAGQLVYPPGTLSGELMLRMVRDVRGWPFATRVSDRRAALDLNEYLVATRQVDVILAPDDPLWAAFERIGREEARWTEPVRLLQEARDGGRPASPGGARRLLMPSILALGGWSMAIAGTLVILLRTAEITMRLMDEARQRRRKARARRNRCVACGYDLRGLDFHPRCPECGALVE